MTDSISESDWIKCDAGWVFDQSEYVSTIGSQVTHYNDTLRADIQITHINAMHLVRRKIK